MKAVVLKQLSTLELRDVPEPGVQHADDAIVRITTAGICGSDLHIVHGRDPGIRMGTIMGHEFTGVVEEVGSAVRDFKRGDRVVAPFSTNCGECFYCIRNLPARCIHSLPFGFVNEDGKGLEGAQAEYVRVPLATSTLHHVPAKREDGTNLDDEDVLFLGDIFSTAYSTVEAAAIQKGDVVVVIGCGPVGLLAVRAAQLLGAGKVVAIDRVGYRRDKAQSMGATDVSPESALPAVREFTDGRGADAVIEAVGHSSALDLAIELARPGAIISVAGYHTAPTYPYPIHTAYSKNLTLRIGRCSARKYIPILLPLIMERKINLTEIVTHRFPLSDGPRGYELFNEHKDRAIKVLLKP